jgi:hypothetical protein
LRFLSKGHHYNGVQVTVQFAEEPLGIAFPGAAHQLRRHNNRQAIRSRPLVHARDRSAWPKRLLLADCALNFQKKIGSLSDTAGVR